jgi:hypothetical protein
MRFIVGLLCHMIRNVAVKRRRVEARSELLNKEAVDVQEFQIAGTCCAKTPRKAAAQA